jgi:hypothetical protein
MRGAKSRTTRVGIKWKWMGWMGWQLRQDSKRVFHQVQKRGFVAGLVGDK